MSRKLIKDLKRDKDIYQLSEDLHSEELGEYYFLFDEQELLAGHSQNYHFDEKGIPLDPSQIPKRRKQVTRSWWNKEWFSRTLAMAQACKADTSMSCCHQSSLLCIL